MIFDKCRISNLFKYFEYLVPTLTREPLEKVIQVLSFQFSLNIPYPIYLNITNITKRRSSGEKTGGLVIDVHI